MGGALHVAGQVCFHKLCSARLERFDSRFRPFGAGIINEILLARHPQAPAIPITRISESSLSCSPHPYNLVTTDRLWKHDQKYQLSVPRNPGGTI
jgi:hypothetical protein